MSLRILITIAKNVAKINPFSTFGCNYVNSLTNNINAWYSNIMPEEKLDTYTVRELIEVVEMAGKCRVRQG